MALYGVDLGSLEAAVFELRGGIAVVTLNRPEALNALNTAMHRDIAACWEEINHNEAIRAAVVTGSGRFFCAGRDIKEFVGTYGPVKPGRCGRWTTPTTRCSGRRSTTGISASP